MRLPLADLRQRVATWFGDVESASSDRPHYPLFKYAESIGTMSREQGRWVTAAPNGAIEALALSALNGERVPAHYLHLAIARAVSEIRLLHSDDGLTAYLGRERMLARVGLIRLILNRSTLKENPMPAHLDESRDDPAYVNGRLFAVRESLQRWALGDVNASVVDKFFERASANPASVANVLEVLSKQHLNALKRKQGEGARVTVDRRLTALSDLQGDAPGRLTAAEQAAWLCGYNQQRQHDFETRRSSATAYDRHRFDRQLTLGGTMTSHTDPTVKHDALLIFDAIDSNPNGDPDNAGKPRVDYETGDGIVSDASLKRKIRDAVIMRVEQGIVPDDRNLVFIRRGDSLNEQLEAAYRAVGEQVPAKGKATAGQISKATAYMKEHYFDVRLFGAVMSTGNAPADKVTGPVTIGIARSYDPVLPMELGITRTASTKEEAKDNASQMGSKTVVPYGLYAARIHYQPTRDNRVTEEDLRLFWQAIGTMFEVTRSAARPSVNVRRLDVFSHDNPLGNAPAITLLDRVAVSKVDGVTQPTGFSDYVISGPDELPSGVTHHRLV